MRKVLALAVMAGLLIVAACDTVTTGPTVKIVYPADGATIGFGGTVIKATATDDAGVTQVQFYDGSTSIGVDSTATADTFSVSWSGGAAGAHTLKAVATNDDGKTAEHSITVTVTAGNAMHHSGEIATDETWYPANNPHIIDEDVYTGDGVKLTIMPGCYVQFSADAELYTGYGVPGSIVAVGKADSMITFTSLDDTVPGFWECISFYDKTISTAKMSYCNVLFGGKTTDGTGAIKVQYDGIPFDHNLVRKSGSNGVWLSASGSFSSFTNNTVTGCTEYAIHLDAKDVPTIGAGNALTGNTKNGIEVRGGSVEESGTWLNHGVPYVVIENGVDIVNSATLTIEPGCTIALGSGIEFYCGYSEAGSIIAVGTAAAPITFTSAVDTVPGGWRCLSFYSHTISTARLSYVTVEYAGGNNDEGAVYVADCNIKMDHCTLRKNATVGVYAASRGYFADFSNNTITTSGEYPVRIDAEQARTLGAGNILTGNTTDGVLIKGMNIATTGTWLNHGVPYVVDGSVDIADNSTNPILTIAPGCEIRMKSGCEFYVGYSAPGGLICDGTAGRIKFTSNVNPPSPGDWMQVSFYSNAMNSQCKLINCDIAYGGSSDEGDVYIADCTPTVTGCDIGYSSAYGIYLSGSEHPSATDLRNNNTFHDNASGDIREP